MRVVRTLHGFGNAWPVMPLASDLPVDAIEADAWIVRGVAILQHARPVGALPLALHTRGLAIGRGRATLTDLLAALAPERTLLLDLRAWFNDPAPDLYSALAQLSAGSSPDVVLTCESWGLAERLAAWMPERRIAYSVRSESQLRRYVEGRAAGALPPLGVAVRHSLLHDRGDLEALQRYAPRVAAWTVDDVARARDLAAWGVDEVVSNHIEVLAAL
ncbi:MAG: hypothetical protein U0360_04195 [Dehalococcoidia bacterium]